MADTLPRIFDAVPAQKLARALRLFQKVSVDYGTLLMAEGDVDPTMICLLDGSVEIRTGDLTLATAGPGEMVGEMALFTSGIRTAEVVAIEPVSFLILEKRGYETLRAEGNPVAAAVEREVVRTLVERLRETSSRISRMADGTPVAHVVPAPGFFQRVSALFGGGGRVRARIDGASALRASGFFVGGTADETQALAARTEAWTYSSGHFLCTEGELGEVMFVLVSGLVDVVIETTADRVEPVAVLEPGDVFGQVSLVQDQPRMASCIAKQDVTVLELSRDVWRDLEGSTSDGASLLRTAIIRGLTDQIAYANAQLAMLDLEAERLTMEDLEPLVRASAGVEAHGKHLDP